MDFMDDMLPVGPYCHKCQQREELFKSDIFESLSELFAEYLADMGGSKDSVLEQDRGLRHKLKHQISELCHFKPKSELVKRFTQCVEAFVTSMEEELKTKDTLKLPESYNIMNLASKEVSRIVSPVFQGDWKKAHSLIISIFYSNVFKPYKSQLAQDIEITQIEEEIGKIIQIDGPNPLQDMGIEELVSYINSPSEKKQRKKKKPRQTPEDFEVENFKKKLNEEVAAGRKLVPIIDHKYINKWRKCCIKARNLTKN